MINNLHIFDYILIVVILLFVFFSIWKGFIQSILGLMTWIGSIIITLIFYNNLSNYFSNLLNEIDFFENTGLSEIIGIVLSIPIIFLFSLIILKQVRKMITSDIDKATLGVIIDKFFGIIYGLFFSYFIFSLILFFISKISYDLTYYLTQNSQILLQIQIFNEEYVLKHLPLIFNNNINSIN
tara:strand:- start:134 stop:679 length:546 start_codon:yes stop_codon:yes gene_type:complete